MEVNEGIQRQTSRESIPYVIKVVPAPTSITSVTVYDAASMGDVTADVMPSGSPSFSGNLISLPLLQELTPGHKYLVRLMYDPGDGELEVSFTVICTD